ncbi:MAG: hypothetical protein OXF84_00425 [Bacteroidetes bacterium]|nr:hypothetical protein [Bacteroidota bacterium]
MGKTHEMIFNSEMAKALRRVKSSWREHPNSISAEETGKVRGQRNKRPDLIITDGILPPVIIESSYNARDADKDAQSRLGLRLTQSNHLVHSCIALHIPASFQKTPSYEIVDTIIGGVELRYAVHRDEENGGRWPKDGYISGNIYDLIRIIPSLALSQERVSQVSQQVADLVKNAANILMSELSDDHQELLSNHLLQRSPVEGIQTMMLMWLNALLVQQRLAVQGVDVKEGEKIPHVDPLNTDPLMHLNIWTKIRDRNWRSIFKPAIDVLEESLKLNAGATKRSLCKLVECVREVEDSQLGLHISVGAELFPKLSVDRKRAAQFYTLPAAAEMLAHLTILDAGLTKEEWKNTRLFDHRKVADLACGTGTLLRAGYRRVRQIHEQHSLDHSDVFTMHRLSMEGGLIGVDISPIAAHLTTSSLASLGVGDTYGDTQIGWVEVGAEDGQTGALEFFDVDRLTDIFSRSGVEQLSGTDQVTNSSVHVPHGGIDWVLMNPPYSRTRKNQSTFDIAGLSEDERSSCQKRWGEQLRKRTANKTAGMGASFLLLGSLKCKYNTGRIGCVLPLTGAFVPSWAEIRRMVEHEFKEIIVITGPPRESISSDTNLPEMLLVATKRQRRTVNPNISAPPTPIYCCTLRGVPRRYGEASETAKSILSTVEKMESANSNYYPIKIGNDEVGIAFRFMSQSGAPWNPLGALDGALSSACNSLIDGEIKWDGETFMINLPMSTIGGVFEVGPTHHMIGHPHTSKSKIGAFEFHPIPPSTDALGKDSALWKNDWKIQNSLVVAPTHYGIPVLGESQSNEEELSKIRQMRTTLFYNRSIRWTSQSLLAASTDIKSHGGSAWAPLRHDDMRVLKMFSLWANSIMGFMMNWTCSQRMPGRSRCQINAIRSIPCPDFSKCSDAHLDYASVQFDRLKQKHILPACEAHHDDVRIEIDHVVTEIVTSGSLKIREAVKSLRWLWCNEPFIHNDKKAAIEALKSISKNLPS